MTRFARTLDYPDELSWLPDWRDASQYPPVEGTSGTRWAWEFLRRNPEYQKAYSELTHVSTYIVIRGPVSHSIVEGQWEGRFNGPSGGIFRPVNSLPRTRR